MRRRLYRPVVVEGSLPERPVLWPFGAVAISGVWNVARAIDWLLNQGGARRNNS
jgi:hypothetical protein